MKIITTVGTSLLTNSPKTQDAGLESEAYTKEIEKAQDYINLVSNLKNKAEAYKEKASAEIASIEKIDPSGEAEIYFVCTETVLSKACGDALANYFGERVKRIDVVFGLQVENQKKFETEGLRNLIDLLESISSGYWWNIKINMTGGYKAIIPFLTIYGQVNGAEIFYTFNDDEKSSYPILKIPQTPIDINWAEFEKYSHVWEDLRDGIYNWDEYKLKHQVSDDFHACIWIDEESDSALLNGLGEAFYRRYRQWTFIWVLRNGHFSNNFTRRKALLDAISGLQRKLNDFIKANQLTDADISAIVENIRKNGGELDHTDLMRGTQGLIAKYPSSNPEIRILYSFDVDFGKVSKLKIWDFRIENFNHGSYPKEFRDFFESNLNSEWVPFLQTKND